MAHGCFTMCLSNLGNDYCAVIMTTWQQKEQKKQRRPRLNLIDLIFSWNLSLLKLNEWRKEFKGEDEMIQMKNYPP